MVKKIAIIMDVNPLEYCGGAERWVLSFAQKIIKYNVEVSIFVPVLKDFNYVKSFNLDKRIKIVGLKSLYKSFKMSSTAHMPHDFLISSSVGKIIERGSYDNILLNNTAVIFAEKLNKYGNTIGIIHDFFPVCPIRDLICVEDILNDKQSISHFNCIKCVLNKKKRWYHFDYLLSRKILFKKIAQTQKFIYVSESQKSLLEVFCESFFGKKTCNTSYVISGPILNPFVEEIVKNVGLPRKKEYLAVAYLGGFKLSRGFDRFVYFVEYMLKNAIPIKEIHLHGKLEEKSMQMFLKKIYKEAIERKIFLHVGYIEYSDLIDEMRTKAYVALSSSRYPEPAPLYVIETYALGSLVLSQRRIYGPYELSLKILKNADYEIYQKNIEVSKNFSDFLKNTGGPSAKKLTKSFIELVNEFFSNEIYFKTSKTSLEISEQNFNVVKKTIFE